jgi:putative flippase GtrA
MKLPAPLESLWLRVLSGWREGAVSLKALSFAIVGLINTAVDATIFFLLLGYVTPSLVVANVTAWFIANTGSYVMNSLTTFSGETGGKLTLKHYAGFVGSGIVAVTATTLTILLVDKFLPMLVPWTAAAKVGNVAFASVVAKVIAIFVSFAVNFSITHFVVFRPRAGAAGEQG